MLTIKEHLDTPEPARASLTLTYERRQKSRQRVRLDHGEEAALALAHGTVLHHGDRLRADNGWIIAVHGAVEPLSVATTDDALSLARACYHLGNRHVALQIACDWMAYARDPVLDALIASLGLSVYHRNAIFEPEQGAYHDHGRHHAHAE